jgi:hypothetical protein
LSDAQAERGDAATAGLLGGCIGALCHSLIDVFYVCPVRLAWPHPREWSVPLLLPSKAHFSNLLFKVVTLADFACDLLFFALPVLLTCRRHSLHGVAARRFAVAWAAEALILLICCSPPLLANEELHHEDFIFWLHAPCGVLFILATLASPLVLRDAVLALAAQPRAGPACRRALHSPCVSDPMSPAPTSSVGSGGLCSSLSVRTSCWAPADEASSPRAECETEVGEECSSPVRRRKVDAAGFREVL